MDAYISEVQIMSCDEVEEFNLGIKRYAVPGLTLKSTAKGITQNMSKPN
jgi:hypothetical protein